MLQQRDGAARGRAAPARAGRARARDGSCAARARPAFPLAVAALNRAGLGPAAAPTSRAAELRRAGLRAMGEVAARLGLGDAHVVFGHTHRAGPLPGDDRARVARRERGRAPGQRGLLDLRAVFLTPTPGESPYWPGACVLVEDRARRAEPLLPDRTHAELTAHGAAAARRRAPDHRRRGAQATPGVKQVARHSTPGPMLELQRRPSVWRGVLDQRVRARVRDRSSTASRPSATVLTRTVPTPSSTAHTPPAS